MAQPTFDPALKTLVELGPGDWTVFAEQPAAPTRVIDADIATVSGAADKVLYVAARPPYLLHLEFVAGHDAANLPLTLHKRNILLEDRHDLPVRTVVVLLQRSADSPALTGLRQRAFPQEPPYNVFGYVVRRVWTYPAAHFLDGGLGTLSLAVVGSVTKAELPGIIKQMKKRLRQLEAREAEGEVWAATEILLGLRETHETAVALLRGVRGMRESSTYRAIVEEGRLEGLEQGRQEGATEALRKVLLELGSDRFGEPSRRVQRTLTKITDANRLEALIRRLNTVESWQTLLAEDEE